MGKEVYYYLTSTDLDKDKIAQVIEEAEQPNFFMGLLACFHRAQLPSKAGLVTRTEIAILAKTAELIIVGAFDGEGYMIWHHIEKAWIEVSRATACFGY